MAQSRGRRSILKLVHGQTIAVVLILSYLWLGCHDRCEACSSVAFDNGTTVFATNYDNQLSMGLLFVNVRGQVKSGLSAGTNGQTARWITRYASITFNAAGYQLPWALVF